MCPARPRRRGFTLLELMATLAVVAVLATAAITRMQATKDKASQEEVRQRLSGVQVELARIAADAPQGTFSDTLWMRLEAAGVNFVEATTASSSPDTISVGPLSTDSTLAVAAARSDDGRCLVVIYGYDREGWGVAEAGQGQCRASNGGISPDAVNGAVREPSTFSLT